MLKVTVAVVCYNERDNIKECLSSLVHQTYPRDAYELVFVDNESDDGTREIIRSFAQQYDNIRLIVNPVRGIAGSRNLALKEAQYDYIAFVDADCVAPENWLHTLASGFERYHAMDSHVVGVGGSNVPPENSTRFYDVLRIFLNTYLGSRGSTQGMRFAQDRPVPHIPTVNVLFDKKAVLDVGGFDTSFGNIGEDQDLSYRLQKRGYYYYYLSDAAVIHKLRSDLKKWAKNMYVYGLGRMWLIRKHPDRLEVVLLAPFLLVASFPVMTMTALHPIFAVPALYFVFILLISFIEGRRAGKLKYVPDLFVLYSVTHIAYGIGQWAGLFVNRRKL